MKKFLFFASVLAFCLVGTLNTQKTSAQKAEAVSQNIVISQFQTGRQSPNANDEFVELHNIGAAPVNLNGYKLVYRTPASQNDITFINWNSSVVVPPGGYYLIASIPGYDGGVQPDISYAPGTCNCSLGGNDRGMAIRDAQNNIVDAVAWGTFSNLFFEGTPTTAHPIDNNDNAKARKENGCQDTDNNANDFETVASVPRNASSPAVQCTAGGPNIFASMSSNPSTVVPGNPTLLTVNVIPAVTPPSTGINVTGDLVSIGGSATQQFFDNGTNGDVTAGDNVWSYSYSIPANLTGGIRTVFGTVTDAQARTANVNTNININAPLPDEDPLTMGNPSGATADPANENNFLMVKPQYTLSYNRSRAIPNWTAWRLDSTWIGSADRQDDFRPDPGLPAGWYQVTSSDYSGSGYDRGHMCPSGDRTRSIPDNSATFLMTNIIPQYGPNNQGPWADLEVYCRTLASQGKELYIISGGHGTFGTISQGRVVVPDVTWKVVMVLNNGADDLQRVTRSTRVFGVIMPNHPPLTQGQPWRTYRVTVNAVEYLTGYDFFSNVPKGTQEIMERQRDRL